MELKDLTTKVLSKFGGGQLEVQSPRDHYLYRGEVAEASVEDDTLKVRFAWLAKMKGGQWINDENPHYSLFLWSDREKNEPLCSVQDISEGRFIIRTTFGFVSEILFFFPPDDGSKLDPAKVVGLALAS